MIQRAKVSHGSPSLLFSHLQIHLQSFRLGTEKDSKKQILCSFSNPLAQELSIHGWRPGMGSLLSGGWLVQGHTRPSPAFNPIQQVPERVSHRPDLCTLYLHPTHPANAPPALTVLGLSLFKIISWVSDYKVVSIHFRQLGKFKKASRKTPLRAAMFALPCFSFPSVPTPAQFLQHPI